MGLAIEAMKKSVSEPRSDKTSPMVGAAILMPDGKTDTAYRGELRYGDHAEYTLLERKHRGDRLDGSILFTTLEPCAPGTRHFPKLGCSERIINARISEVWVGIEDPDPTVDHKGIKYLLENGIKVNMFPSDLQEIILQENNDFLEGALQRREAAEKAPKKVTLSKFEDTIVNASFQDLSTEALEKYRKKVKIDDNIESPSFKRILIRQGLLTEKEEPTSFGFLLFGNQPRDIFHQAGLLGTIQYQDGTEDTREFNGPLVLIPDQVETWLKDKAHTILDRGQMESKELLGSYPLNLIREAVVNALIHRDYDINGALCHIDVTSYNVTVKSPGEPSPPITIKQMQDLNAPRLSRNPKLTYVFKQMGLAEERRFGLNSFKAASEIYHLPLPQYSYDNPYLILKIYTSQESAVEIIPLGIRELLNEEEIKGLKLIASKTAITKSEYAKLMGLENYKAQRQLRKFVELKLLLRIGEGPSTKYQAIR